MPGMKILNIDRRYTNETAIALPFETDEQVVAAWRHVVTNRLLNFSYRPETEGHDHVRSLIERYLKTFAHDGVVVEPLPNTVRRFFTKIYGAELSFDICELVGLNA